MVKRNEEHILKNPILWVAATLVFLSVLCLFWLFGAFLGLRTGEDPSQQLFTFRAMQIILGMVVGLATTFLGLLAAWYGLASPGDTEPGSATTMRLVAAMPGVILVLCGIFLVFSCITKEPGVGPGDAGKTNATPTEEQTGANSTETKPKADDSAAKKDTPGADAQADASLKSPALDATKRVSQYVDPSGQMHVALSDTAPAAGGEGDDNLYVIYRPCTASRPTHERVVVKDNPEILILIPYSLRPGPTSVPGFEPES